MECAAFIRQASFVCPWIRIIRAADSNDSQDHCRREYRPAVFSHHPNGSLQAYTILRSTWEYI